MKGEARAKLLLPPIDTVIDDFPIIHLDLASNPGGTRRNVEASTNNRKGLKVPQYSLEDDVQILRMIKSFYGWQFRGRVPWGFWETFRKATSTVRSSSSLYHHWNGVMNRKYGSFLVHGLIDECIAWLEGEIEFRNLNASRLHTGQTVSRPPEKHTPASTANCDDRHCAAQVPNAICHVQKTHLRLLDQCLDEKGECFLLNRCGHDKKD
jgi:hypothetical protein